MVVAHGGFCAGLSFSFRHTGEKELRRQRAVLLLGAGPAPGEVRTSKRLDSPLSAPRKYKTANWMALWMAITYMDMVRDRPPPGESSETVLAASLASRARAVSPFPPQPVSPASLHPRCFFFGQHDAGDV